MADLVGDLEDFMEVKEEPLLLLWLEVEVDEVKLHISRGCQISRM